ncbi:hypothetical protein AArcSl_1895 [Halalkaliarchaeum desulfuricum]|uniref:DUF302 domain-containing protein n=1 Tax=Halalkaliarchaeum desulfuricum TaxID=2055893 RepID=A0A343TK99_9EURY|nr:DUF302 domain-containing protein [Halalkaliarchaeum desulfuricum]AUX09521.1 hypothetical protein AArcSl_1895 [Halalkaliarchaeum desulfuricum]
MTHTITTTVDAQFDDAVAEVTTLLEGEGFGILSTIDVQTTLKEKLDVDVDQYQILGACNPALAHRGLVEEPALGALLPCNVIVYEADDDIVVSAVDPQHLFDVTDNPELAEISTDVHERFERVITAVGERFASEGESQ